jgi:hypothetical protein
VTLGYRRFVSASSGQTAARPDGAFVPARAPGVVTLDLEGDPIVFDEASDQLHLLNPTAALIWSCFDGATSVGDLSSDIGEALGVPAELVLGDALDLVVQLGEGGLVLDGRAAPARGPAAPAHPLELSGKEDDAASPGGILLEPPDT